MTNTFWKSTFYLNLGFKYLYGMQINDKLHIFILIKCNKSCKITKFIYTNIIKGTEYDLNLNRKIM